MRIGGRFIVLKRHVVAIIARITFRAAAGIDRSEIAIEPAPRHFLASQQVADIRTGHLHVRAYIAVIETGLDVFYHRSIDYFARHTGWNCAVSLSRHQVQMAHDGHAEGGLERVVAHRIELSIVPQGSYGVAVVVAHRQIVDHRTVHRINRAGELDEHVEQAAVVSLLLIHVEVRVVAGESLRSIEAEGIDEVEVLSRDQTADTVRRRRIGERVEFGLERRVGGDGIGGEVMIERHIFVVDNDQIFDRRLSRREHQ